MPRRIGSLIHADSELDLACERESLLERADLIQEELDSRGWEAERGGFLARAEGAARLQAGEDSATEGAAASPKVIRGANPQGRVEVGIDWLRMSGDGHNLPMVKQILEARFGQAESGKGRFFYTSGWLFHGGLVGLFYDGEGTDRHRGKFTVEIPGSALGCLEGEERIELLRDLARWGMKCTRIDVAVDLVAHSDGQVELVEAVHDACTRGELVGARRWRPVIEYAGNRITGASVYLGKRGSQGSGRMVRCYDKGLETGAVANTWHRWEAEFSGDVAAQVGQVLAERVEWVEPAVCVALGAVDFRVNTGVRDSCRRPRAEWWASVVRHFQGIVGGRSFPPFRIKARRKASNLRSWREHQRRAVLPTLLAMAREGDCSPFDIVAHLLSEGPVKVRSGGVVLAEWRAELLRAAGDWRAVG